MKRFLRRDLQEFRPYAVEPDVYTHKLDANESPFHLPANVREAFAKWVCSEENLNIYPDTQSTALRGKIARLWSVAKENVVCGVGSDQLIEYITKMLLEPGACIVVPTPSFSMYKLCAALNHGRAVEVPLIKKENEFIYDMDSMAAAAKANHAKAVFLCTPNNPTGLAAPLVDVEALIQSVDCPVIVDEAYGEFGADSAISLVKKYSNVLALKTFSKAYGAAGVRLGYGVGSREMIDLIEVVRGPYNLSTPAQVLGGMILDDTDTYQERIAFLIEERGRVFAALNKKEHIQAFRTDANFIYAEAVQDIAALLKEKSILVRSFGQTPEGKFAVRISIGSSQANDALIQALKEL